MLYLIGLGLNVNGISKQGLLAIKKCSKIYLENYTVNFPYTLEELSKVLGVNLISLNRADVESDKLIIESKKENIALLIYGCPLFATTHTSLIIEARKKKVKTQIIYSASIFDAVAETGLQLYKFGKTTSMPAWKKNFTPDSFVDVVKENLSIKAHSLILCDIGLEFPQALEQFEESLANKNLKLDKILVCSSMGTEKSKIIYNSINELKKIQLKMPFCIIVPGDLHFAEKEFLENF